VYDEQSSSCQRKPDLHIRKIPHAQIVSILIPVQKVHQNAVLMLPSDIPDASKFIAPPFTFGLDGSFNVTWRVNCSDSGRLQCGVTPTVTNATRLVSSMVPSSVGVHVSVSVDVNASGLRDRSVQKQVYGSYSGEQERLSVTVRSQGDGSPELSHEFSMLLALEVWAQFDLDLQHVEVSSAGLKTRAAVGSVVGQVDDDVVVLVTTSDAEGLPIYFPDAFLNVKLAWSLSLVHLKQSPVQPEVHFAVLPPEWFPSAGHYDLILSSTPNSPQQLSRQVRFSFEIKSPWWHLLIAAGVGLGVMLVLLALLLALVFLTPHKTQGEKTFLVKSFVKFELKICFICTVELMDFALDFTSLLAVTRDGEAEDLQLPYTAIFGCSTVASACTAAAFVRLLVMRLYMRVNTYARSLCLIGAALSRVLALAQASRYRKSQVEDNVRATVG
jgi:hypothetical protein